MVHHVQLPDLREEAAHCLLVLLPVLDGPSPGEGRSTWAEAGADCPQTDSPHLEGIWEGPPLGDEQNGMRSTGAS